VKCRALGKRREVQGAGRGCNDAVGQLRHGGGAEIANRARHCKVERDNADARIRRVSKGYQLIQKRSGDALPLRQKGRLDQNDAGHQDLRNTFLGLLKSHPSDLGKPVILCHVP
jgi:hypothetical protein